MAKRKSTKRQTTIYKTDHTMAKRKWTKRQTTIYKTDNTMAKRKWTNNDLQNTTHKTTN